MPLALIERSVTLLPSSLHYSTYNFMEDPNHATLSGRLANVSACGASFVSCLAYASFVLCMSPDPRALTPY